MNYKRFFGCAVLATGIASLGSCRKGSEASTKSAPLSAPATTPAVPEERHHRMFTGGVSPLIVSLSPQTIPFHDGHVPVGRYALTYEINNSEKATKAFIVVYAPGVGEIQKSEVDVQPRAQIEFFLNASNYDFGPTVRFRAHCPYGDTDWFLMGTDPLSYPERMSSKQIGSVSPSYIDPRANTQGGEVPVQIWGSQITRECTPEAQVDGTTVELKNVVALDKQINALLSYSDLQGRRVSARHFEVNLLVYGPGMPAEDSYSLNFVE